MIDTKICLILVRAEINQAKTDFRDALNTIKEQDEKSKYTDLAFPQTVHSDFSRVWTFMLQSI